MTDFFESDLERRGGSVNVLLARAVHTHCKVDLKATVDCPPRRKNPDQRPYHTFFKPAGIDHTFLVIDLDAQNCLRLDFHDYTGSIHDLGAVWFPGDRGKAVKKEKYVDLTTDPSAVYQRAVLDLVDRILKNTVNYFASR